ncbi:MAG: WG repeat-containing protein [Cyclobacteriaceae bacterium]
MLVTPLWADKNKQALKALEKGDFEKAEEHLQKSLEKEQLNPGAKYIYSLIYIDNRFSRVNLDSAYYFILKARNDYQFADEKIIDDLIKNQIFENDLKAQQEKVESMAFERASARNTLQDFNYFIDHYSAASQLQKAIERRNELVYADVRKTRMWQAYKDFIENYPSAAQIPEAKKEYERLLYLDYTDDGKLHNLERFLRDHPNSPHRTETERKILEIRTAFNQPEEYLEFLTLYPKTQLIHEVMKRFFHLDKDFNNLSYFDKYAYNRHVKDSLQAAVSLNKYELIPFYERQKYGFMNEFGEVILQSNYDYIKEEYLCGNIKTDLLEVRENRELKLINYVGASVYSQGFDQTTDLGAGFVKLRKNGRFGVWHKGAGDILDAIYQDAELLGHNLIKAKLNGLWGVFSVWGQPLMAHEYDEISRINNFWIFEKDGLLAVTGLKTLKPLADGGKVDLNFKYDEVELVKNDHLLCFSGDSESLINSDLDIIINESDQTIIPMGEDWMVKRDSGYSYYREVNNAFLEESFRDIAFSRGWLGLKRDSTWTLLSEGFGFEPRFGLDTVRILNNYIVYFGKGDTTKLAFYPGTAIDLDSDDQVKLLGVQQQHDSSQYLSIKGKILNRIYSEKGELMFRTRYADVDYLTDNYFSYQDRRYKGILDNRGEIVVKAAYEGIGHVKDSLAAILSRGEFGAFDLGKQLLIKPKYKKRIEKYSSNYLLALGDEGYGFLNRHGEEVSDFIFTEVEYWTDEISLVKSGSRWALFNIGAEEELVSGIQSFEFIRDTEAERLAYFLTDDGFGVFSNTKGEILAPSFNDIINLGTPEKPLYFAEKHVPEADFYVVVYVNAKGETIRSEAFREEEYEMILCEN